MIGSAKMPWLRPIIGVVRVLAGAPRERGEQRVGAGEEQVGRVAQQDRERGVEHVARRHPAVEPARLDAGELLDVGEEGDDVVLGRPLDLVDARRVELRASSRGSCRGARRDELRFFHRLARRELDLEPRTAAARSRPESSELGGV